MSLTTFNNLPALAQPQTLSSSSELKTYLNTDLEDVPNIIVWWHGHCKTYPQLFQMALDYLTIPATSIDVECIFSHGHLLLSYVQSCLSAQMTCALLCVGLWSLLGLVKDNVTISWAPPIFFLIT
ncbi:hypothetical protein PAXRUDRAFT_159391 [Paxillus rubicundulus Ve08.2h10]|uniref:HAT C-terminal dimerisation domain-containing protein n=1 Tax=Paxillus rubicundulus Ve08.2h10 TaxID=930991 RepID=A0A0D0DG40_9AGAM|nr:hypothetical protein PAXRUDRAFT_159391 [Paxillus rubicundulus Ve08.2h10]